MPESAHDPRESSPGRPADDRFPDDRLSRALAAFVRHELAAPAIAMTGFVDILIEDARLGGFDDIVPDLTKMRASSLALNELADRVASDAGAKAGGASTERLRHDFRTSLSAIKGYAEMLVEEARDAGRDVLLADLERVLGSADHLLALIDRLAQVDRMAHPGDGVPPEDAAASDPETLVADVLRTIRPAGDARPQVDGASRILVVDDNESIRELLSRRLTREGHTVSVADDGPPALAMAAAEPFDLILLDLMMPGMNGLDVLQHLKADERLRHIPVIVFSALDEVETAVRCIEAGAEDYLPKPINPVLLRARITASLDRKRLRDREQAVAEALRAEKERGDALLRNILPHTVIARMQQGETRIADRVAEATILFCDLVGFTALASTLSARETVDLLSRIFSSFDRLAAGLGLEKIKTIGDAYMVAGGLPEPRADHAAAVADMALQVPDIVAAAGRRLGLQLQVRIGMHTGAVVAGVIGTHRFIYDVWGDTVNVASRLETHGEAGRVHVSAATRAALGTAYRFEPRGEIDIRGRGPMETWFLLGRTNAAPRS